MVTPSLTVMSFIYGELETPQGVKANFFWDGVALTGHSKNHISAAEEILQMQIGLNGRRFTLTRIFCLSTLFCTGRVFRAFNQSLGRSGSIRTAESIQQKRASKIL